MSKRTRFSMLGALLAIAAFGLAWAWWPESSHRVESAAVEAAAQSARDAQQNEPPQLQEPKREGRAAPGTLGQ